MGWLKDLLQPLREFWTPVPSTIPGLQRRVLLGTRAFVLLGGGSVGLWSSAYILSHQDPRFQTFALLPLMIMLGGMVLAFHPWLRRRCGALLFVQFGLFEGIWAIHNPLIGPTEIFYHAMSLPLVGLMALFTPIEPRYLLAYGALLMTQDVLTLYHGTHAQAAYLALAALAALISTALAMLASQLQRRVYLKIHNNRQRQQAQERLFIVGQRTEQMVERLRAPLHHMRHQLLDQRARLAQLQAQLTTPQGRRELAPGFQSDLQGVLAQAQQLSATLRQIHTPRGQAHAHAPSLREALLLWHQEQQEVQVHQLSLDVPEDLKLPGDPWALRRLLDQLALYGLPAQGAALSIQGRATFHGVSLRLQSTWRGDLAKGALAPCADIAQALFQGQLKALDAHTLVLELNQTTRTLEEACFTPGFSTEVAP